MAFSISPAQTVLWDQIRYSGRPSDFAWVLPVRPGARIELSHDAWMASLEATTQTVINAPMPVCSYPAPAYEASDRGGGGCGCFGGDSASETPVPFAPGAGAEVDASASGPPPVEVVSQDVVGPYDAVTVRSSQGDALGAWLRANGYDVAPSIQPVVDAFTGEGFDFIALKLRPGQGVQAMQPVRVVTEGADPTLPLRMVAAGVGARVGIELYVLSEGRYHPQNFPDATIDFSSLVWNPYQNISNYSVLAQAALDANGGTGWITEAAYPVNLFGRGFTPALEPTYMSTCSVTVLPPRASCPSQSGGDSGGLPEGAPSGVGPAADSGIASEAGDDGATILEAAAAEGAAEAGAEDDAGGNDRAGNDGAGNDPTACAPTVIACDDLDVAMTGVPIGSLWVTKLRADLPAEALSKDLVLEAESSQQSVQSVHSTNNYSDPNYNPCPGGTRIQSVGFESEPSLRRTPVPRPQRAGDAAASLVGVFAVALSMRSRRSRR
jgi:hypothetical protein